MANLSQQKRQRMLKFLQTIREEHKDDDVLIALGEIESELNAKKYGLVWEQHEEAVDIYRCGIIFLYLQNAQIKRLPLIQATAITLYLKATTYTVFDC